MNHFERAIIRMEACDAACTELITMAKKDIVELEKRRANALEFVRRNIYADTGSAN